jgi:hypothetical protein
LNPQINADKRGNPEILVLGYVQRRHRVIDIQGFSRVYLRLSADSKPFLGYRPE